MEINIYLLKKPLNVKLKRTFYSKSDVLCDSNYNSNFSYDKSSDPQNWWIKLQFLKMIAAFPVPDPLSGPPQYSLVSEGQTFVVHKLSLIEEPIRLLPQEHPYLK